MGYIYWFYTTYFTDFLSETVGGIYLQQENENAESLSQHYGISLWAIYLFADQAMRNRSKVQKAKTLPITSWRKDHLIALVQDVELVGEANKNRLKEFPVKPIFINPTFPRSANIGGADAQLILGDSLFDIRTSLKKGGQVIDNIVQQVGYYLLNFDLHGKPRYEIDSFTFIFSRHQAVWHIPVSNLILKAKLEADSTKFLSQH